MRKVSACKKTVALALCAALACAGLASCSGGESAPSYKDGTYEGKSQVLDANVDGDGYCEVTITVKDGIISDAKLSAFQVDGTPKDTPGLRAILERFGRHYIERSPSGRGLHSCGTSALGFPA